MKLNKMAWRTLARNKRRSLITSFSVAFGILLAVTFTGSGDYSYTSMIDTSAVMGFGHVSVEAAGYNDRPGLARRLTEAGVVRKTALGLPRVAGAYARIMGQAMFAAGAKSVGGVFMAIDPQLEKPLHNFFLRSIVKGRLFDDTNGRGAVVGAGMAVKLNLRLGKKVIVTVTDKNGQLTSELTRVCGIFKTGDDSVDSGMVLLPLGRMRRVLNYGPDDATLVAVYVNDLRQVKGVRTLLAAKLDHKADLEILPWQETQPDLAGLIAVDRLFNYLLQFLVGLVIAAGILNTMLMSVLERTREFGIMMAVGMTPRQVVGLVLIESFWLGVLGLLLGVILTAPWFVYMSRVGIDLSRHIGQDYSAGGVLVDPVMKLRLYKESALVILFAAFGLTMAAGVYPAIRAGRTMPVESLLNS
ncbi:MAG: ABC transporter permease [Deltaproteobacteria bacterium]|nr:ABC transporter permease [Deltaproteobacteria bacterium]